MEIYKNYEGTAYYELAKIQLKDIKETIDENNNSSATTFKNHLFEIAKNEHFKTMNMFAERQKDNYPEGGPTFDELDKNLKFGVFSEQIRRKCERISQQYTEYKQLFKQAFKSEEERFKFRPLETKSLEEMEDGTLKIIHNNKVKKYAHSFLRSYKNLMNEESYNLFDSIMDKELDRSFVQNEIRKIASFKDSNDLNRALTKIVQSEHTVDYILNKIDVNKLDAEVLYQSDDALVLEIMDFEASEFLGSNQWCISTQENYFEEYLFKHNEELGDSYQIDETTIVKGRQLFIFDFKKEPSDPLFMAGITVSANGTIVAAHDKNDNDIFEEVKHSIHENSYNTINGELLFLKGENLFSFDLEKMIETIPFDMKEAKKEILSEIGNPEGIFEKEGAVFYNTINPLHVFLSINDEYSKNDQELFYESFEVLNFNSRLITKSISDYYRFKSIDAKTMVEDLLKAYVLVDKLENYEKSLEQPDEDEEYFDMGEPEMQIDIGIKADTILRDHAVNIIFNQLDDLEKTIIFKDNKELIMDVFNSYVVKLEFDNSLPHLANSSGTIPRSFKSALSAFSSHLIHHIDGLDNKSQSLQQTRDILVFEHCIQNPNPKQDIIEDFMDLIKNNKIHTNKIFGNIEKFSDNFKTEFANFINKNPNYIESINNKILQPFSCDNDFLNKLDKKTCEHFNKSIKSNKINFGNLNDEERFFKAGEFSFSQRMKDLKDKGIIDDDIISRHYNDTVVAFGNKKDTHLFLPKEGVRPKAKLR